MKGMASGFYTAGLAALMGGDIDLENDDISVMLVNTDEYTVDLVNHTDQTDVPDDANLSEAALAGKTIDGTTFRASDTTFNSVTGDLGPAGALIVFLDADTEEVSTLIAYIDDCDEFPIAPDGDDVVIRWDTGTKGIFKL